MIMTVQRDEKQIIIENNKIANIFIIISLTAFYLLHLSGTGYGICLNTAIFFVIGTVIFLIVGNEIKIIKKDIKLLINCTIIEILSFHSFYNTWKPSQVVDRIAGRLSLDSTTFLIIIGIICTLISCIGIYICLYCVFKIKKIQGYFLLFLLITYCAYWQMQIYSDLKISEILIYVGIYICLNYLLEKRKMQGYTLLIILLSYWQMQISSNLKVSELFFGSSFYMVMNVLMICILFLLVDLFVNRWFLSATIISFIITIFSIVNHYVILFHGEPLFPCEFANVGVAINVASGYKYVLDTSVIKIIIIMMIQLALMYSYKSIVIQRGRDNKLTWGRHARRMFLMIGILAGFLSVSLHIAFRIEPPNIWSWRWIIRKDGFMVSSLVNLSDLIHPLKTLDGYDSGKIRIDKKELSSDNYDTSRQYPDIIMIVNETFCDIDEYYSLDEDAYPLQDYYNISDAVYGYSAASGIGSGTNNSEFEVLTSNSMYLLSASAPFTYLDLEGLDANIVSYLNSLGYRTVAMHCQSPTNYSRNKAYPALGFDQVILGEEHYTMNKYGNRAFLDADNYADLLSSYESSECNTPQFYYMLTYQNHGGYEQNDSPSDLIHINNDFGDLTDDINEYLSSVSLSAQAFHDLIDHLRKSNRPVIVCMVGDHAPWFVEEFPSNKGFSEEETEIEKRKVPFVMWSNIGISFSENLDFASMVDLCPILLKSADMPLTSYYKTILSMHNQIPLRMYNGVYLDENGTIGTYSKDDPYYDILSNYYYLEYNGLKRGDDYKKWIFTLTDLKS